MHLTFVMYLDFCISQSISYLTLTYFKCCFHQHYAIEDNNSEHFKTSIIKGLLNLISILTYRALIHVKDYINYKKII